EGRHAPPDRPRKGGGSGEPHFGKALQDCHGRSRRAGYRRTCGSGGIAMAGIVKPRKSYDEQRREFNVKRGLPYPPETGAPEEPAAVPPPAAPETQAEKKTRPQPAARKPRPPRLTPTAPAADGKEAVLVKLRVPAPKPGAFPLFDQAAASMGEKRAL